MFWRGKQGIVLVVFLGVVLSGCAWAEFRPKVGAQASGNGAIVTINSRTALRFRASNGALSPDQRAEITAGRLAQLVARGFDPGTVFAKGDRIQGRVYAGETMICIATRLDARSAGTSPLALASSWASRIRTLLLMPPVVLSEKRVLAPLGEARRIEVGGAATGPIYARVDNGEVAAVAIGADGRYVQVTGQKLGQASVEVSVEGERAILAVAVKKYAGYVSGIPIARVTGAPCPESTACQAARQAISQAVVVEPGASFGIESVKCAEGAIGPGRARRMTVAVRIGGGDYIPYRADAPVDVQNIKLPPEVVDQLLYSNDPERVMKYRTLLAGKLDMGISTRLLYHHQNMMGKAAHLLVDLINPNPTPVTIRVFRGISSPMTDTVLVGYRAGLKFLKDYRRDVSVIETIPAGCRLALVSDALGHLETASGILQMRVMDGQPVYVRVAALPPGLERVSEGSITSAPDPIALCLSDHIYPDPSKKLSAEYVVGQRWAFISIGKHAIDDAGAQKKLYGNYGVTYDINVTMRNPTTEKKKISVVFDPSAGLASGVFIINGEFVTVKYAKPPDEIKLASYSLGPGETRNVRILTVPTAGSNYPATLVVRS